MLYIIDGYNVMHFREGGGIEAADLEHKRAELVEEVVSFAAAEGAEAVIVFDSRRSRSTGCKQVPRTGVTVCYASKQVNADILIGKLVQEKMRSRNDRIRVVSGDWEVQRGAMQDRVERIHPRNFLPTDKKIAKKLANNPENDRIRWKLEHSLDSETLRKLEEMRRGKDDDSESN